MKLSEFESLVILVTKLTWNVFTGILGVILILIVIVVWLGFLGIIPQGPPAEDYQTQMENEASLHL